MLEKRLHRTMGEVFEVSAAERIENRGPIRDWEKLLTSLHSLVEDSGRNLVLAACERGLQRLSDQLLAILSVRTVTRFSVQLKNPSGVSSL